MKACCCQRFVTLRKRVVNLTTTQTKTHTSPLKMKSHTASELIEYIVAKCGMSQKCK